MKKQLRKNASLYEVICFAEEAFARRNGPMHEWFSLSYSNYLVLPRSLIQEMSLPWQHRMVSLLREMEEAFPKHDAGYIVMLDHREPESECSDCYALRDEGVPCEEHDSGAYPNRDPLADYRYPDYAAIRKAAGVRCRK